MRRGAFLEAGILPEAKGVTGQLGKAGGRILGMWIVSWVVGVGLVGWVGAEETRRAATFRTAVADARRWMGKRQLDEAAQSLRLARENARSDQEKAEVERLESLLDYLRQFWQWTIKGAQKLEAGQEIEVEVSRYRRIKVAVVEVVPGGLRLRVEGVNRLYRWETMPTELVLALAKRSLAKDNVSKVVIGAFLAVDEKGDRAQARKLWEEALQAGLDIGHLLAELGAAEAAAKKPPLPHQSQLQEAEKVVREQYARWYARAKTVMGKRELARKLLADVQKTTDPLVQLVMLQEARELAASACELQMASSAIEQIAQQYEVDLLQMKLQMLKTAVQAARAPLQYRDVVLMSLNLAEEAVRNRRSAEIQAAIQLAKQAARNSKSRTLMTQTLATEAKLLGKKP